ncbi:MAG: hypothetical protein U0Q16_21325 [Bryobacteraceae bacterium]
MANKIYLMNDKDEETANWATRLFGNPNYDNEVVKGGSKGLGQVRAATPISIMAHGTAELAIVVKKGDPRRWTPAELAQQLEKDELQHDHRVLELLICEAGSSVNTQEIADQLEELRKQYKAEQNEAKKKLIEKQFKDLEKSAPSLAPQTIDQGEKRVQRYVQDYSNWNATWLLPFGAALMQELKKMNYQYLRVMSYKYEISAHFNQGKIWVDDPNGGDRPATEADRVQWL